MNQEHLHIPSDGFLQLIQSIKYCVTRIHRHPLSSLSCWPTVSMFMCAMSEPPPQHSSSLPLSLGCCWCFRQLLYQTFGLTMQRIQTLPNILRGSGGIHAGHLPACVMGGLLCMWVTHQRTGPSLHTLTSNIYLSVWTWDNWGVLTDVCKRRFTKSETRNTSWVLELSLDRTGLNFQVEKQEIQRSSVSVVASHFHGGKCHLGLEQVRSPMISPPVRGSLYRQTRH